MIFRGGKNESLLGFFIENVNDSSKTYGSSDETYFPAKNVRLNRRLYISMQTRRIIILGRKEEKVLEMVVCGRVMWC